MRQLDDGYTLTLTLEADDGRLTLEYRPMLAPERRQVIRRVWSYRSSKAEHVADEAVAEHVLDWDYGPPLSCTVAAMHKVRPKLWELVFRAVCGVEPRQDEQGDAENLREGVRLQALYPLTAGVDCSYCQKHWFDPIDGETAMRGGKPVLRPEGEPTLCRTNTGCPKGTPENPRSLSVKNRRALVHYLECVAVGRFPDDPIVKRNARIIKSTLGRLKRD